MANLEHRVSDTRPPFARGANAPSQVTPPVRRPGSLRRTVVMQSIWREGPRGNLHIAGTARDLWTGANASAELATRNILATLTPDKSITSIEAGADDGPLQQLVGLRPGGPVRKAMALDMPREVADATLLHRLLDELGGTGFMSAAAWFQWLPGGLEDFQAAIGSSDLLQRSVEGVCISFGPGSPSMTPDGQTNHSIASHPDAPLPFREDDPLAWHQFDDPGGPNHWRIRYTDIWFEGPILRVSAGFQDSSAMRERQDRRTLFHEYLLDATVDPDDFTLLDVVVTPGSLPFSTCLAAPNTAKSLIGRRLGEFGALVPLALAGTAGCTHLNEVLRNLSDIPAMARLLATADAEDRASREIQGKHR